jgi:hypothetical protein
MNDPLLRPPRPTAFSSKEEEAGADASERDVSSSTHASRDHLRKDLQRRKSVLTREEHQYLENLCIEGDEIEVQLALETLMDDSLFFDPDSALKDESDRGWSTAQGIQIGSEQSESFTNEGNESDGNLCVIERSNNDCSASSPSRSSTRTETLGSEKRQEHLKNRRNSLMLGQVWKTHEGGLAVSNKSSRRSLLIRQQSLSSSSGRLDLYSRPEIDHIFRGPSKALMDDVQSDNNRRPQPLSFLRNGASRRSSLRGEIALRPPRPSFRRMGSEGSRKSVSFKDLLPMRSPAQHVMSDGDIGATDSIMSPRELLHAHPVRSSSFSTLPSLHLAGPIHSSQSSVTSWTGSLNCNDRREGRDSSESEEKKTDAGAVWISSVPTKVEVFKQEDNYNIKAATKLLSHDNDLARPVLMRRASRSVYEGEGIEVADFEATATRSGKESLTTFGGDDLTLRTSLSFDETMSYGRLSSIFRRKIGRSLSDENLTGIYLGGARLLMHEASSLKEVKLQSDDDSWDEPSLGYYDPWKVIEDEYENGYGGGGTLPFVILGTSADDVDAHPHVLSPPLMESLQSFMPQCVSAANYWMKYSLVRDGASLHAFLQYARGASYSVLAIETVDGEVFGCFTSEPWRKNWNYFGGGESFLWRMRHSRKEKHYSIIDQARVESEIDVYPYTGQNNCIQLCTHDRIAVGAGGDNSVQSSLEPLPLLEKVKDFEYGFGLALESDMLHGTTSPSITFGNPSLSIEHSDGSQFEIINLELWTMTPCMRLEDAEKLELGMLFLKKHGS